MNPWYKSVVPRPEVREGRSFQPDEFAIHLDQVVSGRAPADYRDPQQFFARTLFTRALSEHVGIVLRRLSGQTANTAPVLALITQFGGGKTHTLTALFHLVNNSAQVRGFTGVQAVLDANSLISVPAARWGVFVGTAWDPQEGRETPWIDLARQLAGEAGVAELGPSARTSPPGTDALSRVFAAAQAPVLILFDEVLNFMNRHRSLAEPFYAFLQNLTVAITGAMQSAAVISLPRSQVEMTDWDMQWQDKVTKVVRRVARDMIANDEAEIGEVVRRRLFEDLGPQGHRRTVAKAYADWCFERRAQLPPEWTAVDTALTETDARASLAQRFESCYPFHPAALTVFQRKWASLPQYQQTRSTLAMLAQWVSLAYRDGFTRARAEPLLTLGTAPLEAPEFRSAVLGLLGEQRLLPAIDADIASRSSHARALDADTANALKDIHRRVGAAILFESSGGQAQKIAHLPDLRFALGEPDLDTTSIDNAALALEARAYYIRRVGGDGFEIKHKATLRKAVNDRKASLDEETEIRPEIRTAVKAEFERGRTLPIYYFTDGAEVPDSPRLTLVVVDPRSEWNDDLRGRLAEWTRQRGVSPRLYPGALVWCVKKPGRELRNDMADWLAWKRVKQAVDDGTLGGDYDQSDRREIGRSIEAAEGNVKDEVWGSYRFLVLADRQEADGLQVIDLGAGLASSGGETLVGRVLAALKTNNLLNESVGAGYIDRNWPQALLETGAWPLTGLRQSFLNGALTRLLDPDAVMRSKIVEFVRNGEFGLASGPRPDDGYERLWYKQLISPDEVAFEPGVFLIKKARAEALSAPPQPPVTPPVPPPAGGDEVIITPPPGPEPDPGPGPTPPTPPATQTIRLSGSVPPETWNRIGSRLIPKLRTGQNVRIQVAFSVTVGADQVSYIQRELSEVLEDLGLANQFSSE